MRYASGQNIRRGDLVLLAGRRGVVVLSVDGGEYSERFTRADWACLGQGVLIEVEGMGLVHAHGAPDPDLEFLARG